MLNFFSSVKHLEPKCPHCSSKIDYGVTTRFDEEQQTHVCLKCNKEI